MARDWAAGRRAGQDSGPGRRWGGAGCGQPGGGRDLLLSRRLGYAGAGGARGAGGGADQCRQPGEQLQSAARHPSGHGVAVAAADRRRSALRAAPRLRLGPVAFHGVPRPVDHCRGLAARAAAAGVRPYPPGAAPSGVAAAHPRRGPRGRQRGLRSVAAGVGGRGRSRQDAALSALMAYESLRCHVPRLHPQPRGGGVPPRRARAWL